MLASILHLLLKRCIHCTIQSVYLGVSTHGLTSNRNISISVDTYAITKGMDDSQWETADLMGYSWKSTFVTCNNNNNFAKVIKIMNDSHSLL